MPEYEKSDISVNKVVFTGIVGLLALVISTIAMIDYFTTSIEEQIFESVLKPESVTLRELRAREAEVLNSYKLLEAGKGIYQIPISRAMEIIADSAFQAQIKQTGEKSAL